jgi:putative hydrolase of the HAD superfamily
MLLFDIGGVIIDIDPSITENKFKELSNSSDDKFNGLDYRYKTVSSDLTTLFINYEQGFITDSEFRDGIRHIGSIDIPDKDIDNIWNLVIVKLNKSLLDIILTLKNKYSIMILSNTNNIHRIYFDSLCKRIYNKTFDHLFDHVFYSYEMGCRKPDKVIYEKVIDSSGFKPNEIIFFDDMKENLTECEKLGMNTCHVIDKKLFKKNLRGLINN